jgi:LPXTG-motif cell wall-anchored protein
MVEGNTVHDNQGNGIRLGGSNDIQIVSNSVYNNTGINVSIIGFSAFGIPTDNVSVVSNNIGLDATGTPTTNNNMGIAIQGNPANVIIGGTSPSDANRIVANKGSGISVLEFEAPAMSVSIQPQKVSILGNSIYNTSPASNPSEGAGLGIDLMVGVDTDPSPDGQPNTFTNVGPDANDNGDSDTGPNNYINFPTLNSVTQDGTTATINFNLDASDSPTNQYRIEFFSNDTADPSGYGEGQTFLGYTTVSNGTNQLANLTLPSGFNLSNKSISATTTAIDNTTTSGFGSTSEFSPLVTATSTTVSTPTTTPTNLASTGQSNLVLTLISILSLGGAGFFLFKRWRSIGA